MRRKRQELNLRRLEKFARSVPWNARRVNMYLNRFLVTIHGSHHGKQVLHRLISAQAKTAGVHNSAWFDIDTGDSWKAARIIQMIRRDERYPIALLIHL